MKTFTILLAAVLTLSVTILFASNEGASVLSTTPSISLAPITPTEATFEEVTIPFEVSTLAPVTPSEASFEDITEEIVATLAPITPIEADFNDATVKDINIIMLAPVTPTVADFE